MPVRVRPFDERIEHGLRHIRKCIGGLAEKEHGGHSGWMYSVNGAVPMTACSNYVLSNGDSVSWYYVTG